MRRFSPAMVLLRRSVSSTLLSPQRCLMRASLVEKSPATSMSAAMAMQCRKRFIATDGDEDEVIESFNQYCSTTKDSIGSDASACSSYIEKLYRSGNLLGAVRILQHLHDDQIHVGLHTYNVLLQQAGEGNDFTLSAKIFKYLLLSKFPPDLTSYMNIAKALQKVDDCEQILEFIREILEITCGRDPTVLNRIIFVIAKSGQVDKTLILFEELKKDRCCLDVVTFNTVLDMLGKAGRVDQMLCELQLMDDLGHAPDIVTYNTVINCLRRLGRIDLCKSFATEMLERGIDPDLRTYTALIDSFGRAGHISDALEMFDQMKKKQQPSIYVYRALISNLKKAERFDLAEMLSEEMKTSASKILGPKDFKQKFKGRRIRNQGK